MPVKKNRHTHQANCTQLDELLAMLAVNPHDGHTWLRFCWIRIICAGLGYAYGGL